jgi:hypothetical protein
MAGHRGFRSVLPAMNERCKHDLLAGQCSFCSASSSHSTGQVTNEEFMEWLRRLRELRESSHSRQRIDHQSPQPGASAGSTANPAISRRRQ